MSADQMSQMSSKLAGLWTIHRRTPPFMLTVARFEEMSPVSNWWWDILTSHVIAYENAICGEDFMTKIIVRRSNGALDYLCSTYN
jgi:hypothetical protein